jgi:hypothetical protein
MIEIFLLAGAISVELEPYAVENPAADTYGVGQNTDAYGRPFQWSTQRSKPGTSILLQDKDDSDGYGDGLERDVFGRPVKSED